MKGRVVKLDGKALGILNVYPGGLVQYQYHFIGLDKKNRAEYEIKGRMG